MSDSPSIKRCERFQQNLCPLNTSTPADLYFEHSSCHRLNSTLGNLTVNELSFISDLPQLQMTEMKLNNETCQGHQLKVN